MTKRMGGEGRARRAAPDTTRKAMLVAATDVIAEVGYYRASSNEIARRCGFTWGVIQHHFRSREGLLMAVIEGSSAETVAYLHDAAIVGKTCEERVASITGHVLAIYGEPKFVAILQILLDLSRDPTHGAALRVAVHRYARHVAIEMLRLAREVRPDALVTADFAGFLSDVTFGLAVTEHVGRIYGSPAVARQRARARRRALVASFASAFRALPKKTSNTAR